MEDKKRGAFIIGNGSLYMDGYSTLTLGEGSTLVLGDYNKNTDVEMYELLLKITGETTKLFQDKEFYSNTTNENLTEISENLKIIVEKIGKNETSGKSNSRIIRGLLRDISLRIVSNMATAGITDLITQYSNIKF